MVQGVCYRWSMVRRLDAWASADGGATVTTARSRGMVTGPSETVDRIVGWACQGLRSAVVAAVVVLPVRGPSDGGHGQLGICLRRGLCCPGNDLV